MKCPRISVQEGQQKCLEGDGQCVGKGRGSKPSWEPSWKALSSSQDSGGQLCQMCREAEGNGSKGTMNYPVCTMEVLVSSVGAG